MDSVITKVVAGLVIMVVAVFAELPGQVESNTEHRLESKEDLILQSLARIETNLAFLNKKYDKDME